MDSSNNTLILEIIMKAVDQATAVIKSVVTELGAFGSSANLAAISLGVLGGAMLVHGVESAVKFQDAMMLVHTQAGATMEQVQGLTASVEQLALSPVGQSAEVLAQGLYHIESALQGAHGAILSNAAAMDVLKTAAEGARVGHANLETVTNGLIGVMVAFPQYLHNATAAMAELNAIIGSGNVRMGDLAQSIGTGVLPVFKEAGLTIQDYGAALATATDNAMPAEMAATRLRMTISLIEAPSVAATKALASIGIGQTQLASDLRQPNGLLNAVEDLKTHLENSGKTAVEQTAIIDSAFGRSRSSSMINLLIDEVGRLSSKYQQQADSVKNWASDVAAAESTVAARWDQFKEVISTLDMEIASALLPVLALAITGLKDVAQAVGSVLTISPGATAAIFAIAAAWAALNIVIIGGRLAADAWAFSLRNVLPVISHTGAVIGSTKDLALTMAAGFRQGTAAIGESSAASITDAQAKALEAASENELSKATALRMANTQKAIVVAETDAAMTEKAAAILNLNTISQKQNATEQEIATAKARLLAATTDAQAASVERLTAAEAVNTARAEYMAASNAQLALSQEIETAATVDATVATVGLDGALTTMYALLSPLIAVVAAVAGTIGLVVIAAAALTVGLYELYQHVQGVHDAIDGFVNYVKGDVIQAWRDFTGAVEFAVSKVGDFIGWMGSLLSHSHTWVMGIAAISKAFTDLISAIKDAVTWIGNFIGAMGNVAGAVISTVDPLHRQYQATEDAKKAAQTYSEVMGYGVSMNELAAKAGAGFAEQAEKQEAATKKLVVALKDYEAMLHQVAEDALGKIDAATAAAEASMTRWADTSIASAKRMSDGVIAEINKVSKQLGTPMGEMSLGSISNAAIGGSTNTGATQTAAGVEAYTKMAASLDKWDEAAQKLPEQFRAVFDANTTALQAKLTSAFDAMQGKITAENQRHETAIAALNKDEQTKVADAHKAAQQAMNNEQTSYLQSYATANQTHESHLQTILQNFETTFQTDLANFQAHTAEQQAKAAADLQTHRDVMQALQAREQAALQTIETNNAHHNQEWVNQHKAALLEAYQREVALENNRYQNTIAAETRAAQNQDSAFNRQVATLDAQTLNKVQAETRAYDDSIAKLNAAHRLHEVKIEEALQNHVESLRQTLEKNIAAEDARHAKNLADFVRVFDNAAAKIGDAMTKDSSPHQILSSVQSMTQQHYNDALEKATVDILLHGKATQNDIAALQRAAAERDKVTKAEADAAAISGTAKTATAKGPTFQGVLQAEDKVVAAQTKVISDNTTVIKEQSALQVARIDNVATALKDATAVITQMSNVATVAADGQVKAIQDASAVAKAQFALTSATTPEQVALAQAQLEQAQNKQSSDAAIQAANLTVAQDELKEAQDKAANDRAIGAQHLTVLHDAMTVANLQLDLQKDNVKVALDQLTVMGNIEKVMTGASAAQDAVFLDQAQIEADNGKIAQAQAQQQIDMNKEASMTANANAQEALDAYKTEGDKATAAALTNAQKIQEAKDQAHVDALGLTSKLDTAQDKTATQVWQTQDKITQEEAKMIDANTAIIKDNSTMLVDQMDALATAIQDQTKVLTAQGDVAKAQADGQVKAITDGSEVYKAQMAIAHATDAQQLALAQAQLRAAQDKLRFDMMISSAAVAVANQQLRQAIDKAQEDATDAQLKQKVLQDTLVVDQLKVILQQDQIRLSQDQLVVLGDIAVALGAATDAEKLIEADNRKIAQDNANIAQAQQQLAIDQAAEAAAAAQAKIQDAQDAQAVELAKQQQAQIEQQAAIQEAQDKAHEDAINAQKATATAATQITTAIQDTNQELRNDLAKLLEIETLGANGLARLNVAGAPSGTNIMNGWASDSARQAGAPT